VATSAPAAEPGFAKPEPGEHPRLLFRKSGLPDLKKRAATPEGARIVARLRRLLDGDKGTTLPLKRNPLATGDDAGELLDAPVGSVFTLFHPVGYGMLWQLTGERAFADRAQEAAKLVIDGQSDRDARFGLKAVAGGVDGRFGLIGEYNGAAVASLALAYDLCYDAWDEAARRQVVDAVEAVRKNKSAPISPFAETLWNLAVAGDTLNGKAIPAVDPMKTLSGVLDKLPPFGMSDRDIDIHDALRDVTLPLAVHAARVAGGVDLAEEHPRIGQLVDRLIYLAVPGPSGLQLAVPYDYAPMGSQHLSRTGLAGGGEFVQAMAMATPKRRAALRFIYERFCVPTLGRDFPGSGVRDGENDCDTVSPYPHRAVLALVCWPIDEPAKDPGEIMPAVVMSDPGNKGAISICLFRGGWKGPDDVVIALMAVGQDGRVLAEPRRKVLRHRIWMHGQRYVLQGKANGFDRDLGGIVLIKPIAERRWLVSYARDWGERGGAPNPARLIVDLERRDGIEGVLITEEIMINGDAPDAKRASKLDLTGDWRCSSSLTVTVKQDGDQFRVVSDNPWGRGKPVDGKVVGSQVSLMRLGNGLARGCLAPHGHAIMWEDGAVWRRIGSGLEAPISTTPDPKQPVLIRQATNKGRNTLMCVLTYSPAARHGEFAVEVGNFPVVTVGDRKFSFNPESGTQK
jgi:hypothetical protein